MRSLICRLVCAGMVCLITGGAIQADDVFYVVSHEDLQINEGALPEPDEENRWRVARRARELHSYARLNGPGEVYVLPGTPEQAVSGGRRGATRSPVGQPRPYTIAVRRDKGGAVQGSLFVPNAKATALVGLKFTIPADRGQTKLDEHKRFLQIKQHYYQTLVDQNIPGGAWFRRQAREAAFERIGKHDERALLVDTGAPRRGQEGDLQRTFALFAGARAIRENLQLDRLLPADTEAGLQSMVSLDSITGITIAEMDWEARLKGTDPQLDPLAAYVPHDQHAVFFPSFNALISMIDEAQGEGTPILHLVLQEATDARTLQRYQRQLCVELDAFARQAGGHIIKSIVATGSDPYLPTGSDVALLFETETPAVLEKLIQAKQQALAGEISGTETVSGEEAGLKYTGVVSPRRRICSYLAVRDNVVLVTNSLVQLRNLAEVASGTRQPMAALPEYQFFRHRYPRTNEAETAFLMLTDATIRRWCGPKWRIATARRNQAAAILADMQAKYLGELVRSEVEATRLETSLHVPNLGTLRLSDDGVASSTYGSLDFQTPIAELDFQEVTKTEATAYENWRDRYQQYWRRFFDPIGISFEISPSHMAGDVTVMPLIAESDYRDILNKTLGSKLDNKAGDRHPEALAHWIISIQPNSPSVRQAEGLFGAFGGNFSPNPLAWLGSTIELYADADPFWSDLAAAEDVEDFFEENYHRLPVGLRFEVSDNLKLVLFLGGLRTLLNQTAPGLIQWENREHAGTSYVVLSPAQGRLSEELSRLRIYYATTPGSFLLSLNENVIQRFLEREQRRDQDTESPEKVADKAPEAMLKSWVGESVAVQLHEAFLRILAGGISKEYQWEMQTLCWNNLPILNEYRRHFPAHDPMQIQQEFWQTRLVCPGGGEYVWNEEHQTYSSTVYGHPADPQVGPPLPANMVGIEFVNAGLTFEEDGLRARLEVTRKKESE